MTPKPKLFSRFTCFFRKFESLCYIGYSASYTFGGLTGTLEIGAGGTYKRQAKKDASADDDTRTLVGPPITGDNAGDAEPFVLFAAQYSNFHSSSPKTREQGNSGISRPM
jgi:hypothetical protein